MNIASRLESGVAKPGQVVISQNTFDMVGSAFKTELFGEFPLKGLQQKMPTYAVIDEGSSTAPQTAGGTIPTTN